MKVVAVVPAYNEANTVGEVIRSLSDVVNQVIVVDDGSVDETATVSRTAGATVVTHAINRGLGAAIGTGLAAARGVEADVVITFDADGQHRAEDAARLVSELITERPERPEVVIGVRTLDRHLMPQSRRLANWLGNLLTFVLFGFWSSDSQSGLRGFSGDALIKMELRCDRMEVSSEIIKEVHRHKLRLLEIPIKPIYTKYSMSKGQGFVVGLKTAGKLFLHRVMR